MHTKMYSREYKNTSVTIVTAYYEIKSKFDKNVYFNWIKNFFKLKCNLVIFTEKRHTEELKRIRYENGKFPLTIVEKEFNELECWKKYETEWKYHHTIDPEKNIHSPELYCIWAQKSFFVKEAICLNPYKTSYFMWCDIGAFRDSSHIPLLKTSFPLFNHFVPNEKVVFSSVERLKESDLVREPDGIIGDFLHTNRLVGGLWIGDARGCVKFNESYERMLNKYFKVGRFAGKDQSVMISTILEDDDLGVVIMPEEKYSNNVWFFFEYLLSGTARYVIDTSFPTSKRTINLKEIPLFFICPDHNEKYTERKNHMVHLLNNLGFKRVSYLKSSSRSYPKCLADAQVRLIDMNMENFPFILLEDDVEINYNNFPDETVLNGVLENFSYPSFADCVYLGISKCGGSRFKNCDDGPSIYEPFDENFVKVINMLSTHAMLFLTKRYASNVADIIEDLSIKSDYHTDVAISRIQYKYNVFATRKPLFYQSSRFGNSEHVKQMTLFEM